MGNKVLKPRTDIVRPNKSFDLKNTANTTDKKYNLDDFRLDDEYPKSKIHHNKKNSQEFVNEFKINLTPIMIKEKDPTHIKSCSVISTINSKPTKNTVHDITQFHFIKVIGKGTFGKVILAKNKLNGELFALKCVKKEYIIKTKNIENLKNEKKLLEHVSHPFIIKLHFTFQNVEKIFFAFSYYNGGELFFHLSKHKRFPESYVKFYAAEIYLAINYLHSKNIIYRDLKPENIILDKLGHIKLIDFGLAKGNISKSKLTSSICGTNEYIPPEVISGMSYNFNFDWWGLGIIIYELLYGYPPFTDQNKSGLFKKIMHNEPNYDVQKISPEAKDLMKLLLNKDLKNRINPEDVPQHPWFKEINFNDILAQKSSPPFIPKIKGQDDLSNIDPSFLNENIYSPIKKRLVEIDQKSFGEF